MSKKRDFDSFATLLESDTFEELAAESSSVSVPHQDEDQLHPHRTHVPLDGDPTSDFDEPWLADDNDTAEMCTLVDRAIANPEPAIKPGHDPLFDFNESWLEDSACTNELHKLTDASTAGVISTYRTTPTSPLRTAKSTRLSTSTPSTLPVPFSINPPTTHHSPSQNSATTTPSTPSTAAPHPVITRPPFPTAVPANSPIPGLSASTLLRTCFRIGEAINTGCDAVRNGINVIIELYARVGTSYREVGDDHGAPPPPLPPPMSNQEAEAGVRSASASASAPASASSMGLVTASGRGIGSGTSTSPGPRTQHFVFRDLFHAGPTLQGRYEKWTECALWDDDSAVFLGDAGRGKMCRAMGRMKRVQRKWMFEVLNIWEAGREDVEWVRGIVCA